MRGYVAGTEVQEKSIRVKKKLTLEEIDHFKVKVKWISRGRYNYMKASGETLDEEQRVFHIDGDKTNDDPKNLVPIRFCGTKYTLSHSRVLFVPKQVRRELVKAA